MNVSTLRSAWSGRGPTVDREPVGPAELELERTEDLDSAGLGNVLGSVTSVVLLSTIGRVLLQLNVKAAETVL